MIIVGIRALAKRSAVDAVAPATTNLLPPRGDLLDHCTATNACPLHLQAEEARRTACSPSEADLQCPSADAPLDTKASQLPGFLHDCTFSYYNYYYYFKMSKSTVLYSTLHAYHPLDFHIVLFPYRIPQLAITLKILLYSTVSHLLDT